MSLSCYFFLGKCYGFVIKIIFVNKIFIDVYLFVFFGDLLVMMFGFVNVLYWGDFKLYCICIIFV